MDIDFFCLVEKEKDELWCVYIILIFISFYITKNNMKDLVVK